MSYMRTLIDHSPNLSPGEFRLLAVMAADSSARTEEGDLVYELGHRHLAQRIGYQVSASGGCPTMVRAIARMGGTGYVRRLRRGGGGHIARYALVFPDAGEAHAPEADPDCPEHQEDQ